MRLVLPCCCLPSLCGTWPASFSAALCAAEVKNNLMHECFAIFLRVTEFSPPMSRRQVTNRRELLLPLLIPDRHQKGVVFNPCVPPGPAAAINGEAGELPEAWTRHDAHYRASKQANQTTEVAELIARNHLLARLVLQRIRPRTHSGMIGGQGCSPDEPQQARAPIAPLHITTPLIHCAEAPVSAPNPPAIETLLTQLARRRLRNRAIEETR